MNDKLQEISSIGDRITIMHVKSEYGPAQVRIAVDVYLNDPANGNRQRGEFVVEKPTFAGAIDCMHSLVTGYKQLVDTILTQSPSTGDATAYADAICPKTMRR